MKKFLSLTVLVMAVMLLSLPSCKKLALPSMKANFDTAQKNFIFRLTSKGNIPNVGNAFIIVATTSSDITNGEYLTLLIRGDQEKTYNLDAKLSDGKYECEAIYRKSGENDTLNVYAGTKGTITVTKIDDKNKKISGTFAFTLMNTKDNSKTINVTDGTFENLKYSDIDSTLSSTDFKL